MTDDKILSDFTDHIQQLIALHAWLDKLYYNETFANMFNKPVLSMLMTAVNYLIENLNILRNKYTA